MTVCTWTYQGSAFHI